MSRIQACFERLISRGEGALIGYLMAGDPDPERSVSYARALLEGGVDLLELGVPFSDPVADGPEIQEASVRALRAGTTPLTVFEIVEALRRDPERGRQIPIVLMTYYNPILAMGEEAFCKRCAAVGVDGVIVPDLPIEESDPLVTHARRHRMDTIFLATPETDDERLERIARETRGFLYLVARYGVTGAPTDVGPALGGLLRRARERAPEGLPLAVGFGIASREHVQAVIRAGAQGAIVGTAFVRRVAEGAQPEALTALARELKSGTRLS
jgi:tryptophan synthase alpha chain